MSFLCPHLPSTKFVLSFFFWVYLELSLCTWVWDHHILEKNVSTFPGFYVKHVFYLKCINCANVVLWLFHRGIQCILIAVHLCSLLFPLHHYYHRFSLQVSFLHSCLFFFVLWLTEFNQVCLCDFDVELLLKAAEERSGRTCRAEDHQLRFLSGSET